MTEAMTEQEAIELIGRQTIQIAVLQKALGEAQQNIAKLSAELADLKKPQDQK